MNYERRIHKVIDYIGKHLDEKLTLDQLCDVACFSKYHFHRLFTAYTGLSLQQYIRWLRLKRAAHQSGRYAVALHKGSRDDISVTIYGIYRNWLPDSGEELGDLPCIFRYYNFDHEVAETELLTEIWVLLK